MKWKIIRVLAWAAMFGLLQIFSGTDWNCLAHTCDEQCHAEHQVELPLPGDDTLTPIGSFVPLEPLHVASYLPIRHHFPVCVAEWRASVSELPAHRPLFLLTERFRC